MYVSVRAWSPQARMPHELGNRFAQFMTGQHHVGEIIENCEIGTM